MSQTANVAASIFRSPEGEREFQAAYEASLQLWTHPHETFFIDTEFGRCHVIASGPADGVPVVLLHGMTANSTVWYENVAGLQAYRTYCVDVLGDFGRSLVVTRPLKSRQDCADWLGQVLDALHLPSAVFIGHSMGGWLAANFAIAHPERVERLVLMAPVGSLLPAPYWGLFWHVYPAMLFRTERLIARSWNWSLAKGNRLHPTVFRQLSIGYRHCRPQLQAIPGLFKEEEWKRLSMPVLFLVGEEEVIYKPERAIERMHDLLPTVRSRLIPHAGHCLEQPELVNGEIVAFLESCKHEKKEAM